MKMYSTHLKLILAATLIFQVGCNGNNNGRRNGQFYNQYGAYPATQGGLQPSGNAFRQQQMQGNNWYGAAATSLANNGLSMIDGDRDGVTDSMDRCPGTPVGTSVEANGCPKSSSSKDGSTAKSNSTSQTGDESFRVAIDETPLWETTCRQLKGDPEAGEDTDGDGINDQCEDLISQTSDATLRMVGLDKNIFNGALVAAKGYVKEKEGILGNKKATDGAKSILLTKEEKESYDKVSDSLGGFGSAADAKLDRQIAKKFIALSTKHKSDLLGFKALMAIEQEDAKKKFGEGTSAYLPIINDMRASIRGKNDGVLKGLSDKYALIRSDIREMIPFTVGANGSFVSNLSGIASNSNTLRQADEFLYIAETHLVVPASGIELQIGQLVADATNAKAGSKAGMFYVSMDNHSLIVSSDLISNKNAGSKDLSKKRGTISIPPSCKTVHLMIAYFADTRNLANAENSALFSENVFYHAKTGEWKPLPQELMRIKPLDKSETSKCSVQSSDILFSDAAGTMAVSGSAPVPQANSSGSSAVKDNIVSMIEVEANAIDANKPDYSKVGELLTKISAVDTTKLDASQVASLEAVKTKLHELESKAEL